MTSPRVRLAVVGAHKPIEGGDTVKIVIPGGTGHLGLLLTGALGSAGHEVVIVSRRTDTRVPGARTVPWDGRTAGEWMAEVDGADAVINLAGRSVNCRYTEPNLRAMMASRVDSANIVGRRSPGRPALRGCGCR